MPTRLHVFLRAFLLSLALSCFACHFLAGTALERAAFTTVLESFAKPPYLIRGTGTPRDPWKIRLASQSGQATNAQRPLPPMVLLRDDLDGVFQSNPLSPVDFAVLFNHFLRFGVKQGGCSIPLAWETPDSLALTALEQVVAKFDNWIAATPLSRSPVSTPIPQALRRASMATKQLSGDLTALPVVNHIPFAGIVLGGESALAGFTSLDSDLPGSAPALLARWDDRIVLAFPVLAACQQLGIDVVDIRATLGETLQVGPNGPVLPLDRFGRLGVMPTPVSPSITCPAETLIDSAIPPLPVTSGLPWLFVDDRTSADPQSTSTVSHLAATTSAILNEAGLGMPETYHRLGLGWEILLLIVVSTVLGGIAIIPTSFLRWLLLALMSVGCLMLLYLVLAWVGCWLPALPIFAALIPAFAVQTIAAMASGTPACGKTH